MKSHRIHFHRRLFVAFIAFICLISPLARAHAMSNDLEFFENRIRPVLATECYECHGESKQRGGLRLDFRAGLLEGGDSGPALIPGAPENSLLIASINHSHPEFQMPKNGPKLDARTVDDFVAWIKMGAPDPRDQPSRARPTDVPWEIIRENRARWWSFQPVKKPPVPHVQDPEWSNHPVDLFILASLEKRHLQPAAPADKRILIRRLYFALTGLPPTPGDVNAFLQDHSPDAYLKIVDHLLASPRFGERWARHWMDLVRFAETHGSEGDPDIPEAWRYRDYLIRAFNADIPMDRLIAEHIAGDLLPDPRWNVSEEINESTIGIANLRLVEYGFQPVDTLDDQVKVVENQIDVLSKAFQGLTVACARCHDHKFDPVSQRDFYALYGILAGVRPSQLTIDAPGRLRAHRDELEQLKQTIKSQLAELWRTAADEFPLRLIDSLPAHAQPGEHAQDDRLQARIAQLEGRLNAMERTAIQRAIRRRPPPATEPSLPIPLALWSFEGTARDLLGELHGELLGGAQIKNGRLQLNGQAHVRTSPLTQTIHEKTFEVWLTLADRQQRGGAAITLETSDGNIFDALVFGEKEAGQWMAGSDAFNRTRSVNGPLETAGPSELIHIAIVYDSNHRISIYRNGLPYGAPYIPRGGHGSLRTYPAGSARLLFGLRHTSGAHGFLAGEIEEARLYDRALTPSEIAASFESGFSAATPGDLTRAFSPEEQFEKNQLLSQLPGLRSEFESRFPNYAAKLTARRQLLAALAEAAEDSSHPLHPWTQLPDVFPETPPQPHSSFTSRQWREEIAARAESNSKKFQTAPNISAPDLDTWFKHGINPPEHHRIPGEFFIEPDGDLVVTGLFPAGISSHRLSQKHNGVLTSPLFKIETDFISARAWGGQEARFRLIVDNYPLGSGGIFPQATLRHDAPAWIQLNTAYRKGSTAYLEFAPADEVTARDRRPPGADGRSFFGVHQILFHDHRETPLDLTLPLLPLLEEPLPASPPKLAALYGATLGRVVASWLENRLTISF
jgi:hypothetical protein